MCGYTCDMRMQWRVWSHTVPWTVVLTCCFSHISSSFSIAKKINPIIQTCELPEINILPRMCVCMSVCFTSWTHQEIWSQSWFTLMLTQLCLTLWPHRLQPSRLLCPWDFPGENTRMVAIAFSRGPFQSSDWTQVWCTGRQVPYCWASREAHQTWLVR